MSVRDRKKKRGEVKEVERKEENNGKGTEGEREKTLRAESSSVQSSLLPSYDVL